MQPRVTAVLVARNGSQYLPRTLAAIAAQVRRPDSTVHIDVDSGDDSARLLLEANPSRMVTPPPRPTFGAAVAHVLLESAPPSTDDEWLWLLAQDSAPHPGALSALLGAVEVAPSVAIAGPKLMRWDQPDVIAEFGETITSLGRSVRLVQNELDQAQHDVQSDLLGVEASGMLVRRRVFDELGGFDPGLPSADSALDLSIRARLAGHRVIGVPSARILSAGPAELFGRRSLSVGAQNRVRRAAQLHRRLAYAPAAAVPLHWLSLVPLAFVRSLFQLLAKRPGAVGGEFAAAFAAAFDTSVGRARSRIRRNRRLSWGAVDPLRMRWPEVRERRAHDRAVASGAVPRDPDRLGFFTGGGAWVVLLAGLVGLVAFAHLTESPALSGGAIVPLSGSVADLWANIGYGWRDVGSGFVGAADPFAYVLAVLGSLTFWAPSYSVVLLYAIALPLAALGAWYCAARFARRPWGPGIAALAWAFAPPFLASLTEGRLGAVIAHLLLPPLLLAVVSAARNWSFAAVAALLFAAVTASAPVLAPALVIGLIAWMAARPTNIHRLLWIPVPAAALFVPLVIQQAQRGQWLALFADPGVPSLVTPPTAWQAALGSASTGLSGWDEFLAGFEIDGPVAPILVIALSAPLAILALLALFLPGSRRAIPALVLALLGYATAIAGLQLEVAFIGATPTPLWPGAALSLYWLGICGAAAVALEAIGRRATVPAIIAGLAVMAVAVPLLTSAATSEAPATESNGRLLPAFASAEAVTRPQLGTIELSPQPDGGIGATVHRGLGTTLDEQSTLESTSTEPTDSDDRLAELAGNLASRSGFDIAAELDDWQIAFVLLPNPGPTPEAVAVHQRVAEALDGNRLLTPVGDTANGFLWNYADLSAGDAPSGPGITGTTMGILVLIGQGVVFGVVVLLAIPTTRRRRVRAPQIARQETP